MDAQRRFDRAVQVFALTQMIYGVEGARTPLEEVLLKTSDLERSSFLLFVTFFSSVLPILIGCGVWFFSDVLADWMVRGLTRV